MGWYSTVLRSKLKKQTPKQTKIILYEHGEVPSVKKKKKKLATSRTRF